MHTCGSMTVTGNDNCIRGRSVLLLIFNGFYQGPTHYNCNRGGQNISNVKDKR